MLKVCGVESPGACPCTWTPCIGAPENMGGRLCAPEAGPNMSSGGDCKAAGPGKSGAWPGGSGGLVGLPLGPALDAAPRRDVLVLLRFLAPGLLVARVEDELPPPWIGRW